MAQATKLAHSLMRFPQKCLNADRLSAYNAAYNATSMEDAFKFEYENGIKILEEESIPGTGGSYVLISTLFFHLARVVGSYFRWYKISWFYYFILLDGF